MVHTLWPGHIKSYCPISNIPFQKNLVSCMLWLKCTWFTYRTVVLYSMSAVDLCIALKFHRWLISELLGWQCSADCSDSWGTILNAHCRWRGQDSPYYQGAFNVWRTLIFEPSLTLIAPLQTSPACPRIPQSLRIPFILPEPITTFITTFFPASAMPGMGRASDSFTWAQALGGELPDTRTSLGLLRVNVEVE